MKTVALAALLLFAAETASAQMVMSSEPPPGQLGAGQSIYVSCGPGKARKVTGGNNIGTASNGQTRSSGSGTGRTRGPCVAMKN
jgi:hypothetical protein